MNPADLIRRRRMAIRQEIDALLKEDAELENLEREVKRVVARLLEGAGVNVEVPSVSMQADVGQVSVSVSRPKTTKQVILEYLERTPTMWRTANDVQDNVSEIKGARVPMSSISPTLSELKRAGLIVRDNLRVALATRVRREMPDFFKENEPPQDTGSGSETGGD